jgi:hypothetical protein
MKARDIKVDALGQELEIGCYVAVPRANQLKICRVDKITPKMLSVVVLKSTQSFLVYPVNAVKLVGPDALAYILKS